MTVAATVMVSTMVAVPTAVVMAAVVVVPRGNVVVPAAP
ncbi:hypothetical protein SAMN04487779_101574 [Belnapia rosea]|uniref:Uncharacterized protein n=1 Tax=Belnapia rosea TaxID=938405 RepID=A0A1G6Z127_9PROT|nr:hypothetical protein SAMN04487779_101574 [Belnapia rosea]